MSLDTSAHDTGIDGEDAANSTSEEVTNRATEGDTEHEESPSSQSGGEHVDHQVPLRVLLEERAKRQAVERERDDLKGWRAEKEPLVDRFEEALPRVREVYTRGQQLEEENQRLEAELKFLRQQAEEHGMEFDDADYKDKQLIRSLAQQMSNMPEVLRAEMRQFQLEQEAKQRREMQEREQRETMDRAKKSFNEDFDALTKDYPALKVQKPLYESLFEGNKGSVSAKELLDPVLMTLNGAAGAVRGKNQPRSVTGQSTTGNAAGTDNVMAPRQRETLSEYFDRIRRAQASGEI